MADSPFSCPYASQALLSAEQSDLTCLIFRNKNEGICAGLAKPWLPSRAVLALGQEGSFHLVFSIPPLAAWG